MAADHSSLSIRKNWLRAAILGILISFSFLASASHPHHILHSKHVNRRDVSIDPPSLDLNISLSRRDDYACSAEKPCHNGACCGASGFCGYGPTYCGTGCVSNCDAAAECGKFAKEPGKTCPLNTCCSEFGFCGTTSEFCGTGCQSNCVLHPMPSHVGSSTGILQDKVIGYYEAWMARKACHKVKPTDLPLDALTHINFAFASIEPSTYQIVTMDAATPASLFSDTTNVKSIKEDIKVFVTIGGWTFSDNGTDTQPLFGEIAGDATKRKTFADNLVHFMRQYGFDGVDLDWEYPGAGDRGGKPEDTDNYVLLLKTLRETFDSSGNNYGLTFTAPSSYWYLRWFDLAGMVKHVDWINVMSYDLHGVWDSTNPIGSIVQGHTNLTEIKSALELFWRVDIPPSKLVLGFGFYGRSFTLADPSCNTPGCPFSGASKAGPCSDTGGMLAYYEIMSVLKGADSNKRDSINTVHDKEAAVNYFTFDNNQWVSYDDKTTFKQKVDWANSMGLGGGMIWASDLDDDQYSAHAGFLDREIMSTSALQDVNKALSNPESVIDDIAAFNGQKCFKYSGSCVHLDDNDAMAKACGSGFTVVGWDDAGCGTKKCHCGKPICCPSNSAPKNCKWRGDNTGEPGVSSDCSAQCEEGEMNINGITSSWGGGFVNDGDTNKCGRGHKAFCCPDPDYEEAVKECSYADCGKDCPTGSTSVFTRVEKCGTKQQKYCCPEPLQLTSCHWVGGSSGNDCANAACNATELQVDRSTYGDTFSACDWGRSKAACCTVKKAPTTKATCSKDLCTIFGDFCSGSDEATGAPMKRDLAASTTDDYEIPETRELIVVDLPDSYGNHSSLVERAKWPLKIDNSLTIAMILAAYPPIGRLFRIAFNELVLRTAFRPSRGTCSPSSLVVSNLPELPTKEQYSNLESEHPIDKQIMPRFVQGIVERRLQSGLSADALGLPPIRRAFWQDTWDRAIQQLRERPPVGNIKGKQPARPNERFAEAFGSTLNPYPFLPTDKDINGVKGKIMKFHAAVDPDKIKKLAEKAVNADTDEAVDSLLSSIQSGFTVWEYMRHPAFITRWNFVMREIYTQLGYIEVDTNTPGLQDWWRAWSDDYFREVERVAQEWADQVIQSTTEIYIQARDSGRDLATFDRVIATLAQYKKEVKKMKLPVTYIMRVPGANPGSPNGEGPSGF